MLQTAQQLRILLVDQDPQTVAEQVNRTLFGNNAEQMVISPSPTTMNKGDVFLARNMVSGLRMEILVATQLDVTCHTSTATTTVSMGPAANITGNSIQTAGRLANGWMTSDRY